MKGVFYMFKYTIRGENIEVTSAIRSYIEKKIDKLTRYFTTVPDATAHVNVRVYPDRTAKVEVTLPLPYLTLRAEETNQDLYGSVDLVADKLERQLRKYKTKINRKIREKERYSNKMRDIETAEAQADSGADYLLDEDQEDKQFTIVRKKQLNLKPMDSEEAILQMNMLGHDFFIFEDVENGGMSVVYRRHDGKYGLISANQ